MKDNIIDFATNKAAIIGGGGGNENWLKDLPVGTVFLSKRKKGPQDLVPLDLFCILDQKVYTTNVIQKIPTGQQVDMWFNTLEFSRLNSHVETIATVGFGYDEDQKQEETKSETTDNDGSNSGSL